MPNINVFVGVNGSGKSTILNSIAISLSWLINRIQRDNASGKHIDELDKMIQIMQNWTWT